MSEVLADADAFRERMASYREAYYRDGVVHIPAALNAENLAIARRLFDYSCAHPSQAAWDADVRGNGETVFVDTHSPDVRDVYSDILRNSDFPALAAAVLGVDRLWFLGEQIFIKKGAVGSRGTPWHQDSDLRINEVGGVGIWMAFEQLDAENCLQFIRRSHVGPCYNPIVGMDGSEPRFLYPRNKELEPFPDIDADPAGHDIVSWDYRPGDVILFHTLTIHGGGPVPPGGERNTLCVRFVGPDVIYDDVRERDSNGNLAVETTEYLWDGLKRGMPVHQGTHFVKVLDRAEAA